MSFDPPIQSLPRYLTQGETRAFFGVITARAPRRAKRFPCSSFLCIRVRLRGIPCRKPMGTHTRIGLKRKAPTWQRLPPSGRRRENLRRGGRAGRVCDWARGSDSTSRGHSSRAVRRLRGPAAAVSSRSSRGPRPSRTWIHPVERSMFTLHSPGSTPEDGLHSCAADPGGEKGVRISFEYLMSPRG